MQKEHKELLDTQKELKDVYKQLIEMQTKYLDNLQIWISVDDKLPDNADCVLIKLNHNTPYHNQTTIGYFDDRWRFENDCLIECDSDLKVTHWMKLPK